MKKVIAVLVTYNPNEDCLVKDIKSFIFEVDKVIICNNSVSELKIELDLDEKQKEKIEIINFYENLGIAKAQNIGMEKAFKEGADFVLQMDQDSIFEEGSVKRLIDSFYILRAQNINVGIIGGSTLSIDDYGKNEKNIIKIRKRDKVVNINQGICKKVKAIISSGSLIPKDVYDKVGSMMEELFIDFVDTEYCWRIKKYGYEIIQNFGVKMYHQTGSGYVEYRKKKYLISAPIRNYYQMRNELYLLKLSYVPFSWKKNIIKNIYRKLYLFPKIMDNGEKRKKYVLKAIKDYFLGNMGKYKE